MYTCIVRPIYEQIDQARRKLGWSVQHLLDESGLDLDISTLGRKLRGQVGMFAAEYVALVKALRRGGSAIRVAA